jgi:tetratricopeptide (TPR) repeat protein
VAVLVLFVASLLYQRFLAPDPLTRQVIQLSQHAERALQEGDLEEALAEYNTLRELTPDDPEVYLRLGVVYEVMGREEEAAQAFARALDLQPSQQAFLVDRGMIYLEISQWESAQADAEAALDLNADAVMGYWILGGVYEAQGQIPEAVEALQQAADLAIAQGNDALYALIKFRLGVLMGGGGVGP